MEAFVSNNPVELAKRATEFKSQGFVPSSLEPKQDVGTYSAVSDGTVRLQPYENTNGKGLLILQSATGSAGKVQIPISEHQIGVYPDKEPIGYTVYKKDEQSPKRIKFTQITNVEKPVSTGKKA